MQRHIGFGDDNRPFSVARTVFPALSKERQPRPYEIFSRLAQDNGE